MAYVIYELASGEIQSGMEGPVPESVPPGCGVGEVDSIGLPGWIRNYVFVPDASPGGDVIVLRGRAERKPESEWDLEAENREINSQKTFLRFHKLDMAEVRRLEVRLTVPSRFQRLSAPQTIRAACDGTELDVTMSRAEPVPLTVEFPEFGSYTLLHQRVVLRFDLTGHEPFLTEALQKRLVGLDETGRRLFTSHFLRRECLRFGVRLTNTLIDCYRVAFQDPWESPLGIADILSAVVVIELSDGARMPHHIAVSVMHDVGPHAFDPDRKAEMAAKRAAQFKEFARNGAVPFDAMAVMELRSALLNGHYRQCVVWAGMIMSNLLEAVLLAGLPPDSPERKRLKNQASEVSGRDKREKYFKVMTGQTLEQFLTAVEAQHPYAGGLAKNVLDVLNTRNLLLHRRKRVTSTEAELAVQTCFEFVTSLTRWVPMDVNDEAQAVF